MIYSTKAITEISNLYKDVIEKYKQIDYTPIPQNDNYPIWLMWWQGEKSMPEIAQICYASIKQNAGNHPVHLITSTNFREYLGNMPYLDKLINLLNEGKLLKANFADIVRCWLIYTYGGVWSDVTILLTKNIDHIVTNNIFLSCLRKSKIPSLELKKWGSYFFFCNKGNMMFRFIHEVLTKHAITYEKFNHYFMIDYCLFVAVDNLNYARQTMQQSPIFPNRIHYWSMMENNHPRLNNMFSMKKYSDIIKGNPFIKLSYKLPELIEYTHNHQLTYYGYIKSRYFDSLKT